MMKVSEQRIPQLGLSIRKWKRNAKKKNFSGSNFDYTLQNGNHQMVVRQNYKEQERKKKKKIF